MTIKQLKRRVVQGLVEPELFYMPVKERYEPMVIKIEVINTENPIFIRLAQNFTSAMYVGLKAFKYSNMEQEYNETGKLVVDASSYNFRLTPHYNLKIKDSSKVLITDDIDYFRNSNYDCLFKQCDNSVTDIIYSKCVNSQNIECEIDWGDGTKDKCGDIIEQQENDVLSYNRINGKNSIRLHTYAQAGEYYITIKGTLPYISFGCNQYYNGTNYYNYIDSPNIKLLEVVKWGELGLYDISNLFSGFYVSKNGSKLRYKYKMPKHISQNSFKNVMTAGNAFSCLDMNENNFSYEIIFDFVKTFPNLLNANYMFGETKISYIPQYFCYNHKNIMNCENMFFDCPITKMRAFAFANCNNLSTVNNLTHSSTSERPLITTVEDSIFENNINLVDICGAFNYVYDSCMSLTYLDNEIGLKTIGNNIYKNCKRLRHVNEPFYQQAGLVTVGESLFEGCEDLIDVHMCFYKCFSLQNIGKNIFKDCSKLRDLSEFFYMCYLVNFPDNMLYDLKYYDYLKDKRLLLSNFNGYWVQVQEKNGVVQSGQDIADFFKYKEFNHKNFPTRKHSKNIFSESFMQKGIKNSSFFTTLIDYTIFSSLITFQNTISNNYHEDFMISNFTGQAFPIWEYSAFLQDLPNNAELFGFRNIKVKITDYRKNDNEEYEEPDIRYTTTINHYNNYMDIATIDPIYYEEHDGYKNYWVKDKLLHTYYLPSESEDDKYKFEVLEFNDPIEERKRGT